MRFKSQLTNILTFTSTSFYLAKSGITWHHHHKDNKNKKNK